MFYRLNEDGNAVVFEDGGTVVTQIRGTRIGSIIYPIGSGMSTRYNHPGGIVLTVEDAERIGVEKEDRMTKPIKHFQKYTPEQRASLAASFRMGHRQKESVGEVFWTHPDVPGIAFPTRKRALLAAEALQAPQED